LSIQIKLYLTRLKKCFPVKRTPIFKSRFAKINGMIEIGSLKDGDHVEGLLAVRSIDGAGEGLRDYSNKSGRFFVIRVGNSGGDITLKYWGGRKPEGVSSLFSSLEVGSIVTVKGRCTHDSYSKGLVISVNEEVKYGSPPEFLKLAEDEEIDPEDFLPSLPRERIDALFSELESIVQNVNDTHLKSLLERFFGDDGFSKVFQKSPAARRNHHNYVGGLLEHTVNVAKLCDTIAGFYPMDRDLLITGALLHDIGKTKEYQVKASIDISDEGRFIGHLSLTAEMVGKEIESIQGFSEVVKNKIIHMILSHHGELEYGSPKVPAFPEAMAIFHADYMDAFVKNTLQEIEDAQEGDEWIYSRSMRRHLHKK
jgi:3'-5' exoribonuclease